MLEKVAMQLTCHRQSINVRMSSGEYTNTTATAAASKKRHASTPVGVSIKSKSTGMRKSLSTPLNKYH